MSTLFFYYQTSYLTSLNVTLIKQTVLYKILQKLNNLLKTSILIISFIFKPSIQVYFKLSIIKYVYKLYYILIFLTYNKMINPTFASFKTVKQSALQNQVLTQSNMNIQPKTFHDLKMNNNSVTPQNQHSNTKGSVIYFHDKQNMTNDQLRKAPINFHLKKSYSQINMMEPENAKPFAQVREMMVSKPKLNTKNYVTAKKNLVHVDRSSKDKNTSRPSITGPSLLKNKSFIYTFNSQAKQLLTHRTSNQSCKGPYKHTKEGDSMDSLEAKSQEINISVGSSSNQDKDSFSYFNSSKFQDSFNLKDSCNSSKLGDKTLNFSRKTNKTIYKGQNLGKLRGQQYSTCFGEVSSLCLMARDLQSSYQSQATSPRQSNKTISQKNPLSISKKFQHYRKPKAVPQPRIITIDEFQLLEEVGQGKYGKVYMAQHKQTGFICALKTVQKAKIRQENIQQPFIREIKIQMYLNHPNIVKLYGFFHDKQNIYLIMQCCLSGHLLKLIKQRKIFEQNEILQIITNVFEAVSFLHCHGIIHRDLKPQNIVIQNDVYKICDFGWAAYSKGDTRTTFCGTPLYVCPQVLKGNQYDEKADIWGLGVLTYQLAYGRVPFPIWSQADMLKIVKDPVYFPTWTSVSDKMQNLIKSMLNKDPSKRLSLNEILAGSLISQYVGHKHGLKCQIQALF